MKFSKKSEDDYVTCDPLSGGDYGGMGYIAHVNVKGLIELAEQDDDAKDNIAHCGMNDWSLRTCVEDYRETPPALIVAEGGYSSITAYVHPDWEEGVEFIEALEQYPVFDDEALSEREMELQDECWESYVRSDVMDHVLDSIEDEDRAADVEEYLEANDPFLIEKFQGACEVHNIYPEHETDGGVHYSDLELIGETIAQDALAETDRSPEGASVRAIRDGLILPLGLEGTS